VCQVRILAGRQCTNAWQLFLHFLGPKMQKVTFTQIDFVAEPEQLETNADMRRKADIREHRKVLGKKLPPPHLGGLPGDWISESLKNTEKNPVFYTLSLNTERTQWDSWAKLSAELNDVCVNKIQASEHWPSEEKHRFGACMCEFLTFFCLLVLSRHCQTMMVDVAGSTIIWTSKASVLAKVCCRCQRASCSESWENHRFQVSPSHEKA